MSKSFAKIDALTGVDIGISYPHHEIHGGSSFVCDAVDIDMGDTDTLVLAFQTAAGTKRVHILVDYITLTGGHVDILEGPTWDNESGDLNPIFNRKREAAMESSNILEDSGQAPFTATDNMILNPANLAGGTIVHCLYAFGNKNQFSGGAREVDELILKPDTQYAYRFTADAASNAAQMTLNWYEHTDLA